MFAWSIEMHLLSDILDLTFRVRKMNIDVTQVLNIQNELSMMRLIPLDLDWLVMEMKFQIFLKFRV
jgi:hypothetical protein